MKLKIPKTIENFVKASNEVNLDKTLLCFAQDATVLDQKENISGHGEISEWFKKYQSEYTSSISPTGIEEKGDRTILKTKVTGNFPGNPVNLDFNFKIRDGLIQDLKIS